MADRPRMQCPCCGKWTLLSTISAHVGSAPCIVALGRRGGQHHDPIHGPRALEQADRLRNALAKARKAAVHRHLRAKVAG